MKHDHTESSASPSSRSQHPARKLCLAVALLMLAAAPATARDTITDLPAHEAADGARDFLLAVPFFLKGEAHPEFQEPLATVDASRASSGVLRSDRASCNAAFLDALRVLQRAALDAGGDALVDVVSITRDSESESATDFRCVAGGAVVHVGLRAKVMRRVR